ncbi:hypothetical protein MNBD_GAMMA05-627 [hydrothermal vent metagenome]|uniref:Uncharacterized protein n=1 Tax=hydrothermal vent metagenome TaxID=652676 RepID=A0A3B0W850_9ZZZZ
MGILITLLLTLAMCGVALLARKYFIYIFSSFFIFFSELGTGFTSFNASFVFNQNFVDLASLKLIEFIVAASYACLLFTTPIRKNKILNREYKYAIAFLLLLVSLLAIEYFLHKSINISDWRNVLVGIIIFHILALTLTTEESIVSFIKFLIIAISIRAAIGLGAYLIGFGIDSPRGYVPFFWDNKQMEAFAYIAIILSSYIASYNDIDIKFRIIKKPIATVLLIILVLTILLSIRRSIWIIAILGILSTLLISRRINIKHYVMGAFAAFVIGIAILSAPPLEDLRNRLAGYIVSMNLFDDKVSKNIENDVHIDNIEKYIQIISDTPSISLFGYRGYPGSDYTNLPEIYSDKYPLGVAHNGILRSIFFFGIGGLAIFFLFVINASFKYFTLKKFNDNYLMKHVAISSILWLFLTFLASLFYIPPFWTTFKGVFYTFISVYMIRAAVYYYSGNHPKVENSGTGTTVTGNRLNDRILRYKK